MDNITHSLVGALAAESMLAAFYRPTPDVPASRATLFRRVAWCISILAGNLPDVDFILSPLLPSPLGYLLHHRGHTHTLIMAVPLTILLLGVLRVVASFKHWIFTRREWNILALLALFGAWIHVGLDSLNSYGVHPFWPWNNRWYYGDTFFIVEPLVWVFLSILTYRWMSVRGRVALLLLPLIAIGLGAATKLVAPAVLVGIGVTAAAVFIFSRGRSSGQLSAVAIALLISQICVQKYLSNRAKTEIRNWVGENSVGAELTDIIASPAPANPFVWNWISVERKPAEDLYQLQRGTLELPLKIRGETAWSAPLSEFQRLYENEENVRAYLRFARAPYFSKTETEWILGDLRFDRVGRSNFSLLRIPTVRRETSALRAGWVPNWLPPTQSLLSPIDVTKPSR